MSVDRIALTGLRVTGHHGVLPQELRDGQEFIIDAVLGVATAAAAAADDLSLTADYGQLADELAAIGSGEPVALIETLAGRLAAACLAHPAVQEADVTVTISRSRVVLALGSNLGDRLANLQGGLDVLGAAPGLHWLAVSPVYETVPAGGPAQGDYLNAVVIAISSLPARAVLAYAHEAEAALGRTRAERWGPRTLDVDLIVSGGQIGGEPELSLPHPRAHERAFVLAPWLDVAPDGVIPGHGRVAVLLKEVGLAGVHRLNGSVLQSPV